MWTISNILTFIRIILTPFIVISFAFLPAHYNHWVSFGIYSVAGITDFFDGYFARKFEETSDIGKIMDPIADKLMVATILLMLVGYDILDGFHIIAVGIIICRELLVSGLREFLSQMKNFSMAVSLLAKWKTTAQILSLGFLIVGSEVSVTLTNKVYDASLIGLVLIWIAAILTVITGWSYLKSGWGFLK